MNFSFGQNKSSLSFGQQQEPPKPKFQVTEQMFLTDLPAEESNDFVSVAKSVSENAAIPPLDLSGSIENDIAKLTDESKQMIMGSLTSLAHQVDYGIQAVKEYQHELDTSRSDFGNKSQARAIPTPFISRYVNRIHREAAEFSEALASYESKMNASNSIDNVQAIYDFLSQQQEAILRVSSHIAKIKEQTDRIRSDMATKLKINSMQLLPTQSTEESDSSIAGSVSIKYKSYINEEKAKADKRRENSDLFGVNKNPPPSKQATGFGSFSSGNFGGFQTKTSTGTKTSFGGATKK